MQLVSVALRIKKVKFKAWTCWAVSDPCFTCSECSGFGCLWNLRHIFQTAQLNHSVKEQCPKAPGITVLPDLGSFLCSPHGFRVAMINANIKRTLLELISQYKVIATTFYFSSFQNFTCSNLDIKRKEKV